MGVTKVQAIAKLIEANGGSATWAQIYQKIGKYYPKAKASQFWQEGIRGVVYREIRYGRTFKMEGRSTVTLR
jgi:hypothetical protein